MKLKNLLQNHWANFNQTWHKASIGKVDSSSFKERAILFSKGIYYEIAKIHDHVGVIRSFMRYHSVKRGLTLVRLWHVQLTSKDCSTGAFTYIYCILLHSTCSCSVAF